MEELVEAGVDDPKEIPVADGVELKEVPKGDLLGCQLEIPNEVELVPLLELTGLASEEGAAVLCPEVVPELKMLVAGLEEGKDELPEEKAALPVNPNNGDDAEPNAAD